ncbi:MAG: ABC transporter substrate-binding protein [Gammaproteobacteria bacterium]|jgi:branched-chain amino acid transport system substrate-binding protein
MSNDNNEDDKKGGIDRRDFLKLSAGVAGGLMLSGGLSKLALAKDYPAIGNYPAGIKGSDVFMGICVPRTGPYSAQGEDEIKGYLLAIDHLNKGTSLARAYSPHSRKGVLGKKIIHGVADNATKPNTAVQEISKFISDNKAMMITGSVSSAVAIAAGKLCDRERTIYLPAITGSNATTGKDCQRYSFRACHYAYTAAKALAPVIKKAIGPGKKVAYLTPDYTYGHSVYNSMKEFTEAQGWKTVNNQLPPLGTSDFSTYLLNIANSGADVLVNICFGRDAVISTKQAKQFGLLDKMTLVMPYMAPFFADEVGADLLQGVYGTTEFWWTLANQNKMAKEFVDDFQKRNGRKPGWSAHIAFLQTMLWAREVEDAHTFHPPTVVKQYEKGNTIETDIGPVHWRAGDHQLVRPVYVIRGKKPSAMHSKDDFYDIVEAVPGKDVMPPLKEFSCKLGPYT